jgi:hypothetical protein
MSMKAGDVIKHIPTGETWTVAATNGTHIICCGWPETMAPITDCVLANACDRDHHIQVLKSVANGTDCRASWARNTLADMVDALK